MVWLAPDSTETLHLDAGARLLCLSLPRIELTRIMAQGDDGARLAPLAVMSLSAAPPRERHQHVTLLFEDIAAELANPRLDSRLVTEAACTLLLVNFLRLVHPDSRDSRRQPPLAERFMLLAAQHWHEHWSVATYAQALGVTRFQLNAALRRNSGKTPQEFLQQQILAKAMALLEQSPLSVAAIAYRLGYQDPAYFSRVFQRQTGQSPGLWRAARKVAAPQSYAAWP